MCFIKQMNEQMMHGQPELDDAIRWGICQAGDARPGPGKGRRRPAANASETTGSTAQISVHAVMHAELLFNFDPFIIFQKKNACVHVGPKVSGRS